MVKTQAKWIKKITEIMWKINPNLIISERFQRCILYLDEQTLLQANPTSFA